MRQSRLTAFVAGAIVALVLGGGSAVAATGGKFILGKSNSAGATSSLVNKAGTALSLVSKPGTPALKVGNSSKVANLNADKLDGYTAGDFALADAQTGSFDVPGVFVDMNENQLSDSIVAFAECPPGTQMTGGGVVNFGLGYTVIDAPDLATEGWLVVVGIDEAAPAGTYNAEDVSASVVCWSPSGPIPGSYRTTGDPLAKMSPKLAERAAEAVAARN